MTRKLVIVNMSNWADEAYQVEIRGEKSIILPGSFQIVNDYTGIDVTSVKVGQANGYEPPVFPQEAIDHSQEVPAAIPS